LRLVYINLIGQQALNWRCCNNYCRTGLNHSSKVQVRNIPGLLEHS
jgi:hypothetical protein